MLRVVLPGSTAAVTSVSSTAVATVSSAAVATVDIAVASVDIGVSVEVVVDVDVDIVPPPTTTAARTTDRGAPDEADTERDKGAAGVIGRVINGRIGIDGRWVDVGRVVGWHIDHFRIRRFHHDHRRLLDDLRFDHLHPLDRVHDITLLSQKGVAKLGGPLDVVGEPFNRLGNNCHRLDARVPGLLRHSIGQRITLEIGGLLHPLLELHDLERVGRSDQHLCQEVVWVECDRSNQRIELIRREKSRGFSDRFGGRLAFVLSGGRSLNGDQRERAADRHNARLFG